MSDVKQLLDELHTTVCPNCDALGGLDAKDAGGYIYVRCGGCGAEYCSQDDCGSKICRGWPFDD